MAEQVGTQPEDLTIRELHPTLGAELRGLAEQTPLPDTTVAHLRELFDRYSVLVFPDLDISEALQRYLVYALIDAPLPDADERPENDARRGPMLVSNKEEGGAAPYGRLLFHCDTMWAEEPQELLSLYGYHVDQPSVPTLFADMLHAWETLPADLRARVEHLEARQGFEHKYANRGGDADVIDTYYEESRWTVTPVARPHPRNGRTALFVSQQVTLDLVGVPADENEEILEALFAHLYSPDNILTHEWRTGDLVIWDNLAVQHARGTVKLEGPERTLRKVFGPMGDKGRMDLRPTYSKVAPRRGAR
jgi:alpha-ketoglutarate-dependent taurine dioxygenase